MVDDAAIPEILPIDPYKEIDPFGQISMTFENEWGIYTLDAKGAIGNGWPNVNIAEVITGGSLIASDASCIDFIEQDETKYHGWIKPNGDRMDISILFVKEHSCGV